MRLRSQATIVFPIATPTAATRAVARPAIVAPGITIAARRSAAALRPTVSRNATAAKRAAANRIRGRTKTETTAATTVTPKADGHDGMSTPGRGPAISHRTVASTMLMVRTRWISLRRPPG